MGKILAFSSVGVTDYSDIGSVQLYLTSSQPTSVLYDPNTNVYQPDWSTSNLVITPVVSYNGVKLSLNAVGLNISYTRKEGSNNATALTTGETTSGGILTVLANKISSVSSGQLTYICKAVYTDPETGVPIETEATLSYALISKATELKYAYITGENTFLYDTNKNLVGSDTIVLTADLSRVVVSQWQYKNSSGEFVAFPTTHNTSISGNTLNVNAGESNIWLNNKTAIIKLATSDSNVYDIHQINKISDGASGNSSLAIVLSNESHYLPCNSNGTVKSWNGASTEICIYEGGNDVTGDWSITLNEGIGLTGTWDSTTHVYTPTALSEATSYVDFVCMQTGYATLTKRFTITKQESGADGESAVIYEVIPDVYAINLNESGVFTPTSIMFHAYRKVGEALNRSDYLGRFIISESVDGNTFSIKYTSTVNESTKSYAPTSTSVKMIKCTLCAADSTTNKLDEQSVVVTIDGATGQPGTNGINGISMGLGNYQDVIPCTSSGLSSMSRDISIPFYAYSGITRIPVSATVTTLPSGVIVKNNSDGTTSSDGVLVLNVANGSNFGNASLLTGDITITLSCTYNGQTQSMDQKFTWTKNIQAQAGENAVILQLFSPDGQSVEIGRNCTVNLQMTSGTTNVTPSAIKWYKYVNGDYTEIQGETGTSITITESMVDDEMFLKCKATYNGKDYNAYITIDDLTDIDLQVYSTITQFKNGQGFAAVYARCYSNGVEIDQLKTLTFSDTAPSAPSTNDYYYHLDSTKKTCVLKKYNGTEWVETTDTSRFSYNYYRIDYQGNSLDVNSPWKTDRVFYIDPSMIDGRMQIWCQLEDQ